MTRGLQLQGLCQWNDVFTLSTYTNANYSSINWGFQSRTEWMGPAPGVPWSRWASDESNVPPQDLGVGDEAPFMSNLFALQLADEWNLNDDTTRTRLVNWFNSIRNNFPSTILYHNNYGGQVSDPALGDFITRAHPDMLSFDSYPWRTDGSANPLPGPPTSWYGDLRRYRQWAWGSGIPYGVYRQTYHSTAEQVRDPSPSELRLMTSAALAYNAKLLTDFVYNAGATSLFTIDPGGYSGDTHTNALYNEMIDVNRRALNLGKALLRLQPIYDLHNPNNVNPPPGPASGDVNYPDGITTGIMFLRGRIISGGVTNATPVPNSLVADPQASVNAANPNALIYTWWEANKNDPYLNGWAVTNKAGIKNSGLPGDVIISWFTPLDESMDGTNYSNEVYMMIVNGLTDPTGSAADCMQEIKINFLTGTSITAVDMLDPLTGLVTTNTMPVIAGSGSSTKRQLVLNLNGGDAVLFKFHDGAPFVGQPMPAKLTARVQAGVPNLTLQGPVGGKYRVDWAASLKSTNNNWNTLTNVVLTSTNYPVTDNAAGTGPRFYRAVAVP